MEKEALTIRSSMNLEITKEIDAVLMEKEGLRNMTLDVHVTAVQP